MYAVNNKQIHLLLSCAFVGVIEALMYQNARNELCKSYNNLTFFWVGEVGYKSE